MKRNNWFFTATPEPVRLSYPVLWEPQLIRVTIALDGGRLKALLRVGYEVK